MYTNQQWIDMLNEVNSLASQYEIIEKRFGRYRELNEEKENIEDNTGVFVKAVLIGAVIFAFVKLGWLRGLIALGAALVVDGIYDNLVVKKKVEKELKEFQEKHGEQMKEIEMEEEDLKKRQSDIVANESYIACKNNLPNEYMGSAWYDIDAISRRLDIKSALENGAETLEMAIEQIKKLHSLH